MDKKRQMEMDVRDGECLMNDELAARAKHHQSWRAGAEEGPLYLGRDGLHSTSRAPLRINHNYYYH